MIEDKKKDKPFFSFKRRQRFLRLLEVTLSNLGWFGTFFFLWISIPPNYIGTFLCIVIIFIADALYELTD